MLDQKALQLTAGSVVVGLLIAAGAVVAAGPWDEGQRRAERDRAAAPYRTGGADHGAPAPGAAPAPSAGPVLAALGTATGDGVRTDSGRATGAGDTGTDLAKRLGPLLSADALGPHATGSVVDVATGAKLYGREADRPVAPASTVKIATMTAALAALGPDHRIPTTVVAGKDHGLVTLVGGGDPSLGTKALGALADTTARVLRSRGVRKVRVGYDTSLYSGPRLHPIGPNDNIAPVVSLTLNEGRLDHSTTGPAPRSGDPAGNAAQAFTELLGARGIDAVREPKAAGAPGDARRIAVSWSAPLADLIENALTESDNDVAESMARQTALAAHLPASFAGGARAVREQLKKMGLPLTGTVFTDGSGLNRKDRVTADLLTALLARAAAPAHPELRPVLTGLPVAGFSGTLVDRYAGAGGADGLVRAKTGTLTGVNTLAGTVVDARGRLLAFAFLAGATKEPAAAESALDRASAALVP